METGTEPSMSEAEVDATADIDAMPDIKPDATSDAGLVTKPETLPKPSTDRQRFDMVVREDFFAGFAGDQARLQRGMEECRRVLKDNPDHAEAMVWLGSGEVFSSGERFEKGDFPGGIQLWQSGLSKMDRAIELEPDSVSVLIPRAATLLPASRSLRGGMKQQILQRLQRDFERVYERQKDQLAEIGEHPLGELRMGLADVYRAQGKLAESNYQLTKLTEELPDTDYAERATKWLAAKPDAVLAHNCIGCHSG
ncbi:MAG: hypothetical protein AAF958_04020 [Planctomycetota bacterium]